MRLFCGNHHIEEPIAVHVGDGGILGGRRVGALGNGDVGPVVGVRGTEGNAHVAFSVRHVVWVRHGGVIFAIRFMHRDDVFVPIVVDVSHDQAIAATQFEPR